MWKQGNFSSGVTKKVTPASPVTFKPNRFNAMIRSARKSITETLLELRRGSKVEDRKIGYGDLDDWNALPASDQTRIRGHSVKLLESFRHTMWFLRCVGMFPFTTKKLEDGSYVFMMSPWNIVYILFLLCSVAVIAIFVLFTLGGIYTFIVFNPEKHLHDRCGNSWGTAILSRNMPAVVFVWTQLMMTAAGCLYVIIHGRSFLEFYNVVNEAVMQLDIDPTDGMVTSAIRGLIVFGSLFLLSIVLTTTNSLHSLGNAKPFTAQDYDTLLPKCKTLCVDCYGRHPDMKRCKQNQCYNIVNTPTFQYKLAKWVGLAIISYSFLGARALIRQFEFFCQVLVNLAKVWNKRFLNYASKDNSINMDDPYRRRITNQLMLKDHYEIVRLYNETEINFSFILFVYYTSVFFNLICQFYYSALLSTQVTCATAVQRERQAAISGKCYEGSGINNTEEVLRDGFGDPTVVSFEDACSTKQVTIIRHASITTIILLIVTLTSFIITTIDADRASHQADVGFYRVRRRGYMSCRTKKERNAMHSLVFSFTGPKPFCITAAKYFPIRKKTIIVIISVAFIYFLIILGFKPGANFANVRCYNITSDNRTIYQVRYPKVI